MANIVDYKSARKRGADEGILEERLIGRERQGGGGKREVWNYSKRQSEKYILSGDRL